MFTKEGRIARYASEIDIMKEFFTQRTELYKQRKEYMLARLMKDYELLFNKVKFIQAVIGGTIKINKVKRQLIMKQCKDLGLKTIDQINSVMSKWIKIKDIKAVLDSASSQEEQEDEVKEEIPIKDYDYLLSMPLWSLTEEKIEELIR